MSTFRLTILIIFGAFIVVGVATFALYQAGPSEKVALEIWGTAPAGAADGWLESVDLSTEEVTVSLSYREVASGSFYNEFIEALAGGEGPDMLLLSNENILRFRDKIAPLPYSFYNQRAYKDAFIQGADIFLEPDGAMALPLAVDPIVTYWNQTLFTNAGHTGPPRYWHETAPLSEEITEASPDGRISRAAIPLGEYDNINNSKEILSALMMQAGTPIVSRGERGRLESVMSERFGYTSRPAEMALDLYTRFSDPRKSFYSWNRSLPSSEQFFLAGDSAMYFGFASELDDLARKNPNLNFDVAKFPQARDGQLRLTYGKMYGIALVSASPRVNHAARAAAALAGAKAGKTLADRWGIAPARRDLLSTTPTGAYAPLFYETALQARSWLEPTDAVSRIFRKMVRDVTSGRTEIDAAVRRASTELSAELNQVRVNN